MANGNHTPNDIESLPPSFLATSLRLELDVLPPLSSMCCIYRVSERLRHRNNKAYTPQRVSIGPIHHGKQELKPMEEHKKRFLTYFLSRTNKSLEDYIEMIWKKEELLRGCYAETIGLSREEFVKIVLVDAAFIIEFLLRFYLHLYDEHDGIFDRNLMFFDISSDLLLLENQIPFFILEELLVTVSFADGRRLSIFDLSYNLLNYTMQVEGLEVKLRRLGGKICHFVDFLRSLCIPLSGSGGKINYLTQFPRATELHNAGVVFKVGSSGNWFDFQFCKGVLEIPKLTIVDHTQVTIRNLLAFEQNHCKENYLSDYVLMMNYLVDTPEDFGLLVNYGIIDNGLEDSAKGSTLIKELRDELIFRPCDFYFARISNNINEYYRTTGQKWKTLRKWKHSLHKWMAILKQNYCNTPWAIFSVIAAILIIILTIIQTVCSVVSVIPKD